MSTVVFDNGSYSTKAGLSGEMTPQVTVPTQQDPSEPIAIERGLVNNWDSLEKLWHQTYEQLKVNPAEHPILLSHPPLVSDADREKLLQTIFEKFNVPSMFLGVQAVLALYATGHLDGFVLDSGHGITHLIPCDKGFDIPENDLSLNVAGIDLNNFLMKTLGEKGLKLDASTCSDIKEKHCIVAAETGTDSSPINYTLPDGKVIELGKECSQTTEALFNPQLIGVDSPGIHQLIHDSIQKCNPDLQAKLYSKIVLAGGNTLFSGLEDRIAKEVKKLAPQGTDVQVIAPPNRKDTVWIGGSILGNLPNFPPLLITKQAYEEQGPAIARKIE